MNNQTLQIIISVFLPPVGVFMKFGLGFQVLLNIVLTLFGYLPGLVHAVWVLTRD